MLPLLAGGSWLRSVLSTVARKDSGQEDASKRTVFGAAHSHFEQPSTAAEMQAPVEEDAAGTEAPIEDSIPKG